MESMNTVGVKVLMKLGVYTERSESGVFLYAERHYDNTPIKNIENFTSKNCNFSDKKNSDIFRISAKNIDCGYLLEPPRRGGSNKYPQSMFLRRNKINNVYPCKPQVYYIKVGFKGVKII